MAKETFYFSHDYDPLSDLKLSALVDEFKADGYGIYWRIVEQLHKEESHTLKLKPFVYSAIAKQIHSTPERVGELVKYAIDFCELFVSDGETFWSERVFRNFEKREEIREKKRKAGKASAEARQKAKEQTETEAAVEQNSTPVEQCSTESNKGKESKVKEIKEKESKEKNYKKVLLSEVEPSDFPEINPEHVDIAKAFQELFRSNLSEAGVSTSVSDKMKGTSIDDVRHMIEIDKCTIADLQDVYRFLKKDAFWKRNILSTSKLREKYPTIKLQMHNGNGRTNTKEGTSVAQLAQIVADGFGAGR